MPGISLIREGGGGGVREISEISRGGKEATLVAKQCKFFSLA